MTFEGSLVDSQDDKGMTAVHHAVEHPECMQLLTEEDADVNAVDADGHTALYYAILDGFKETAIILLYGSSSFAFSFYFSLSIGNFFLS